MLVVLTHSRWLLEDCTDWDVHRMMRRTDSLSSALRPSEMSMLSIQFNQSINRVLLDLENMLCGLSGQAWPLQQDSPRNQKLRSQRLRQNSQRASIGPGGGPGELCGTF
jgi:hypothetical protein